MVGNEFSDHEMEKQNYLHLAHSKLRPCALGPEIVVGDDELFQSVAGTVTIGRGDTVIWEASLYSGEVNMSHSLANLEHHHFKYEVHRLPGDVHIHFYGADAFSFGAGVRLQDGDLIQICFPALGRALRNPIRWAAREKQPLQACPLL
jgi:hypothetical protein